MLKYKKQVVREASKVVSNMIIMIIKPQNNSIKTAHFQLLPGLEKYSK